MAGDETDGQGVGVEDVDRREPVLTVLAHYDPSFVGRRVAVGNRLELARGTMFLDILRGAGLAPLGDTFVSRRPVVFTRRHDAIEIDPTHQEAKIYVDGKRIESPVDVGAERLWNGVVIRLKKRVTLLLHIAVNQPLNVEQEHDLFGSSLEVQALRRAVARLASSDASVLLSGEPGVGKATIAAAIHEASARGSGPFEFVDLAGIPAANVASELFGHTRGSVVGANRDNEGCFVRASGGTLFIDGVHDVPETVWAELGRVLETGQVQAVGAAAKTNVDVRLICATDIDLAHEVKIRSFDGDLFAAISRQVLDVPPLRQRREDIGPLIHHFVRTELSHHGRLERLTQVDDEHPWVSAPTVERLACHDWPRNIGELRSVIRVMVASGRDSPEIASGCDLEKMLVQRFQSTTTTIGEAPSAQASRLPTKEQAVAGRADGGRSRYRDINDVSDEEMLGVLREFRYRLAPAARALGVSRTMLYARVEASDRLRKASDIEADELKRVLADHDGDVVSAAQSLEVSAHALKIRLQALGLTNPRSRLA